MPAGFKSTTLIGKTNTTIPGFVSKVPQDNVTIYQYSKDPEQVKHPVLSLSSESFTNINKILNSVDLSKYTVSDKPIPSQKGVPSTPPEIPVISE